VRAGARDDGIMPLSTPWSLPPFLPFLPSPGLFIPSLVRLAWALVHTMVYALIYSPQFLTGLHWTSLHPRHTIVLSFELHLTHIFCFTADSYWYMMASWLSHINNHPEWPTTHRHTIVFSFGLHLSCIFCFATNSYWYMGLSFSTLYLNLQTLCLYSHGYSICGLQVQFFVKPTVLWLSVVFYIRITLPIFMLFKSTSNTLLSMWRNKRELQNWVARARLNYEKKKKHIMGVGAPLPAALPQHSRIKEND